MIDDARGQGSRAPRIVGEILVALFLGIILGGVTGGLVGVISCRDGYNFGFAFELGATFGVPTGFLFVCVAFPLLKIVGKWKLWRVALVVTLATWAGAAVPTLTEAPPFAWYGGACGAFFAFVALMFPWRDVPVNTPKRPSEQPGECDGPHADA